MTDINSTRLKRGIEEQRRHTASTPPPRTSGAAVRTVMSSAFVEGSWTVIGFALILGVYVVWLGGLFANADGRLLDLHQNVPILLLGLSVVVTLVAGQFDLSVASVATLTTFLTIGLTTNSALPLGLVVVMCLLVGAFTGLLTGLIVVVLGVNTFIASLGTGGVALAISAVYSNNQIITPSADNPLPTWFSNFGSYQDKTPAWLLGIALLVGLYLSVSSGLRARPHSVPPGAWRNFVGVVLVAAVVVLTVALPVQNWIVRVSLQSFVLLIIAFALWLLLVRTTSGRYLYATGANPTAARLAGVPVGRQIVKAFVIGGALAGTAGVLLGASQGSASPGVAVSFLLPAFVAAFLSTVVFSSGRFTVWGALVGGYLITEVGQGLVVGGLRPAWTGVVNGAVLILAVAVSSVRRLQR